MAADNKNFHDLLGRAFGVALVDVMGTVVVALYVAKRFNYPILPTVAGAFVLGEAVHAILGKGSIRDRLVVVP